MERRGKRLKTLNDCYIIKNEEQKSLTLLGILSLSNDAEAKPEWSTISGVGGGNHTGESIKSPDTATVTTTATAAIWMEGEAMTRTSYHWSGCAVIASRRLLLLHLVMGGCCILCSAEAAATPPAVKQRQRHLENVYISRILGLI
jgi:hypothetical protein